MSSTYLGRVSWKGRRDKEGNREYELTHRVRTTTRSDGPQVVFNTSGLPAIGSAWSFGNDFDGWAYCTPEMTDTALRGAHDVPEKYWDVTQKFTTRADQKRCQDAQIDNPLQEPQKVSGSFIKRTKVTEKDRNGNLIMSSSLKDGIKVERDISNATVIIEQNVGSLGLATFTAMVDSVNDRTLWGLSSRKIKLGNISWSRRLYGLCSFYYTRTFEFEIDFNGWDLTDIADKGKHCLRGSWSKTKPYLWMQGTNDGAALNPAEEGDYDVAKSPGEEPEPCLLNGAGGRLTDLENPKFISPPEIYEQTNFLLLGIPTVL